MHSLSGGSRWVLMVQQNPLLTSYSKLHCLSMVRQIYMRVMLYKIGSPEKGALWKACDCSMHEAITCVGHNIVTHNIMIATNIPVVWVM